MVNAPTGAGRCRCDTFFSVKCHKIQSQLSKQKNMFVFPVILKPSWTFHWNMLSYKQQWHGFTTASVSNTWDFDSVLSLLLDSSVLSLSGLSLPWLPSDLTSACFSSMSQTSWRRACIKTTTATATSPRSWSRTLLTSRRATSPSRGQYESNRSTRCRRHTATEFVQVSLIPAPSLFYKNITWNDTEK